MLLPVERHVNYFFLAEKSCLLCVAWATFCCSRSYSSPLIIPIALLFFEYSIYYIAYQYQSRGLLLFLHMALLIPLPILVNRAPLIILYQWHHIERYDDNFFSLTYYSYDEIWCALDSEFPSLFFYLRVHYFRHVQARNKIEE